MRDMSLFSKNNPDLPGVQGTVRLLPKSWRKLDKGDIVVIDAPDISRATAQRLIDAEVAVVINQSQFTSGAVPNYGPQMLADARIALAQGAGEIDKVKDGKQGRFYEGNLYYGDRRVLTAEAVTASELSDVFDEARSGMEARLNSMSGNLAEFALAESPLFIDGLGVPEVEIEGRKVVVVSPGVGHERVLRELKNFIREYEPLLIGVDSAAETVVDAGYRLDFIIGDPANIDADVLRAAKTVILPADPDGHAIGLERIQDLGIGAMTFPALSNSATDLALVLAGYHGAEMVVNVGAPLAIDDIYASDDTQAVPSALLARLMAGTTLVDGSTVANLYRVSSRGFGVAWAILAIFIALAVIIAIAGTAGSGSIGENLVNTWNSIAIWFQELIGVR